MNPAGLFNLIEMGERGTHLSPGQIEYLQKREREFYAEITLNMKIHSRIASVLADHLDKKQDKG